MRVWRRTRSRHANGRRGVAPRRRQAMPADPFDLVVVERRDLAVEARTEHLVARALVAVVAAVRQFADLDPEFFRDFAPSRVLRGLTAFDPPARQSPTTATDG